MRFAFIAKQRHIWPVSWLCGVPEVSRSGFHAWLSRPPGTREIHDAKRVAAIGTSFRISDRTCGARRVWRDVLEEGLAVRTSPDRTADADRGLAGTPQASGKAGG